MCGGLSLTRPDHWTQRYDSDMGKHIVYCFLIKKLLFHLSDMGMEILELGFHIHSIIDIADDVDEDG